MFAVPSPTSLNRVSSPLVPVAFRKPSSFSIQNDAGESVDARNLGLLLLKLVIERFINEESNSPIFLTHLIPAFYNFPQDKGSHPASFRAPKGKESVLDDMRQSLLRLYGRVQVEIFDTDAKTHAEHFPRDRSLWVTTVPQGWDHISKPTLFLSGQILGLLVDARVDTDMHHVLVRIMLSMTQDLGYLWAMSRFHHGVHRKHAMWAGDSLHRVVCGGRFWLAPIETDRDNEVRLHTLVQTSTKICAGILSDEQVTLLFRSLVGKFPRLPSPWFTPQTAAVHIPFDGDMRDIESDFNPASVPAQSPRRRFKVKRSGCTTPMEFVKSRMRNKLEEAAIDEDRQFFIKGERALQAAQRRAAVAAAFLVDPATPVVFLTPPEPIPPTPYQAKVLRINPVGNGAAQLMGLFDEATVSTPTPLPPPSFAPSVRRGVRFAEEVTVFEYTKPRRSSLIESVMNVWMKEEKPTRRESI